MISPRRCYTFLFAALVLGAAAYLLYSPEKPWDFTEKLTARAAEGKPIPIRWHMAIGLWWGTLAGGTIAAILIAFRSYFTAPLDPKKVAFSPRVSPRLKKLIIASAAAATLASGILNAPRTTFSLWGDEEATLRKAVLGEFDRDKETAFSNSNLVRGATPYSITKVLTTTSPSLFSRD